MGHLVVSLPRLHILHLVFGDVQLREFNVVALSGVQRVALDIGGDRELFAAAGSLADRHRRPRAAQVFRGDGLLAVQQGGAVSVGPLPKQSRSRAEPHRDCGADYSVVLDVVGKLQ